MGLPNQLKSPDIVIVYMPCDKYIWVGESDVTPVTPDTPDPSPQFIDTVPFIPFIGNVTTPVVTFTFIVMFVSIPSPPSVITH